MIDTTANPRQFPSVLPTKVADVFNHFFTAELTSVGRNGVPITWPIMPIYWAKRGLFVALTSIGLPQKAFNLQRNPKTALLFSDPTGSEVVNPPIVLVQGTAKVEDRIMVARADADPELIDVIMFQAKKMVKRQPAVSFYMKNPITRFLMDWYFMRLLITIKPRKIHWWENGDYTHSPQKLAFSNVD